MRGDNPGMMSNGTANNPGTIDVRDLRVSYGDHVVIDAASLSFPAGAVTAIIGPSGCGKTTLLRSLNRLSELTRGCKVGGWIGLDGDNVMKMDPVMLRRRVGMVFQKPNPFPMSIRENVLYGIKAIGMRKVNHRAVVEECLTKAALWDEVKSRLNHGAFTLSLGHQQRLCIARSLAVRPRVILMDEPAASLDPVSTARLEESIVAMKREYTVVVVTHDMQEAKRVSDYTAFMYMGEIVEFGETGQIFQSPVNERTRAYLEGHLQEAATAAAI
jgi:phosphate transport system ATP-binding protein